MLIGLVTYINVSVVPACKPRYNFDVKFFYTVVAKCYKKYMPPINAFCINCNILIKPQSVDAFCTKNFSLMQNASTLPTHFVTKKSKCTNCNIDAKCVVSNVTCFIYNEIPLRQWCCHPFVHFGAFAGDTTYAVLGVIFCVFDIKLIALLLLCVA